MRFLSIMFVWLLPLSVGLAAEGDDENIAKLTRFAGDVKILTSPQPKVMGEGPHVLLDGQYYRAEKPKMGMRLEKNSVVQTGKAAKAKFIYKNGDQVAVSPGSAYKVSWGLAKKDKSIMDLMFGKVRLMIMKDGPRSGMEVRTRSMSMGVRGTDFVVAASSDEGGGQVVVMRGSVEVTPAIADAKPVTVPTGYSLQVPPVAPPPAKEDAATDKDKPKPEAPVIRQPVLKPATPKDLLAIQTETKVEQEPTTKVEDQAVKEELAALEKQAVAATLTDIKKEDPVLYEAIIKDDKIAQDPDNLNTVTVKKAFEQAKKRKPSDADLGSDADVYDKYFKLD